MSIITYKKSIQGYNHLKANPVKPGQDSSCMYFDEENSNYCIIAVADGHGGDDYFRSQIGSKIACEVAIENIKEFLVDILSSEKMSHYFIRGDTKQIDVKNITEYDRNYATNIDAYKLLKNLEASIISDWNSKVKEHFLKNDFSEEELTNVSSKARSRYEEKDSDGNFCNRYNAYGSTLIVVAYTNDFWFVLQIGDGKCIVLKDSGEFCLGVPINEKCCLNSTTSICDKNAWENFREYFSSDVPSGVFIGTDGVEDSFKIDDEEQLYKLYYAITCSFLTSHKIEAEKELNSYLPVLSQQGSGDDISVAFVIDYERCKNINFVKEYIDKNFLNESNAEIVGEQHQLEPKTENTLEFDLVHCKLNEKSDNSTELFEIPSFCSQIRREKVLVFENENNNFEAMECSSYIVSHKSRSINSKRWSSESLIARFKRGFKSMF